MSALLQRIKLSFEDKKSRYIVYRYNKFIAPKGRKKIIDSIKDSALPQNFLTYFSNQERQVEIKPSDLMKEEALVTCYFTKKTDPIQGIIRSVPDIKYILPWYESVVKHKLFGIVIHDGLDPDFIRQYENEYVQFRKYEAGKYSIFEERWFAYYLFLSKTKLKKAFFTDANDVYITTNPFGFVSNPHTVYVGRDNANRIRLSGWILNELETFQKDANYMVPSTFYFQPVYNAGVLGGHRDLLLFFISKMIGFFMRTQTDSHKDMSVINLVIHNYFFPSISYHVNEQRIVDPANDSDASHDFLVTGYPLNSEFKKLQLDSDAYFIHK